MPQDALAIKEKIMSFLKIRGPSLPVHIAKETGLSPLFASAFLSELFSEKRIKISDMKVGNSPLYFIPGHEYRLEYFSQHLKSKEKDAFTLLKEKKFLVDKEQEPAIRVALRAIKDFAIPFKRGEEIFWRYFSVPETEIEEKISLLPQPVQETEIEKPELIIVKEKTYEQKKPILEKQQELNIFDKKEIPLTASTRKRTVVKVQKKRPFKKTKPKKEDKFFNKVKEFLSKKAIEITDIEGVSKNELSLKIKDKEREKLLIAYKKKRITESDIIKAHKKAKELNLAYTILCLGEPPKKTTNLMEALATLSNIEKIE